MGTYMASSVWIVWLAPGHFCSKDVFWLCCVYPEIFLVNKDSEWSEDESLVRVAVATGWKLAIYAPPNRPSPQLIVGDDGYLDFHLFGAGARLASYMQRICHMRHYVYDEVCFRDILPSLEAVGPAILIDDYAVPFVGAQ